MSDWKKVEAVVADPVPEAPAAAPENQSVSPSDASAAEPVEVSWSQAKEVAVPTPAAAAETPAIRSPKRYTRHGRRRGRQRFAAPLGLLVLLLAATGVVALVMSGVRAIQSARDDTALRQELMRFLDPVIAFIPDPFEDVNEDPQDSLMLSAIWKLTEEERIRQIREKDEESIYAIDEDGFMLIPVKTITASYASLFGPDAVPQLKSLGDPDTYAYYAYDAENQVYRIPFSVANSPYTPVLDTLKKVKNGYQLRVGYVSAEDIGIDMDGELVDPTPEQASFFQIFHVQKSGDGWKLTAVEDVA